MQKRYIKLIMSRIDNYICKYCWNIFDKRDNNKLGNNMRVLIMRLQFYFHKPLIHPQESCMYVLRFKNVSNRKRILSVLSSM